ncbi:MAG: FtsX-like permease family protein [Pirellulales bacterium]|nr:FtsX-like permease family protein [Pirellulales bacterium]
MSRNIPLAWRNLVHDRLRTLVAIAGVAFAVVLVFLQLGFLGSVRRTATLIYDQLEFDLLIRSHEYLHISRPGSIPQARLFQARAAPGVTTAQPLYIGYILWIPAQEEGETPTEAKTRQPADCGGRGLFSRGRSSEELASAGRRAMLVLAENPDENVVRLSDVQMHLKTLKTPGSVLVDTLSRSEFGCLRPGLVTDFGRQQLRLTGQFTLPLGFAADGAMITSDVTFGRLLPQRSLDDVSLGLVRVEKAADPVAVKARLEELLPGDVEVLTCAEALGAERTYWVSKTSVGVIFGTGAIVALLVGVAIVYQVLASSIVGHLKEYATLKAIGYTPAYLSLLVLQQAWILAVAGFVPGSLVSWGLYRLTARLAGIPMHMGVPLTTFVFVSCLIMCSLAGLGSMRKVHSADPAALF